LLMESTGSARVDLELGTDDEGYRSITGRITARAMVQCQRCLGPVALDLAADVSLAMVWAEKEIPALPSRYDGIVVGQDPTDPLELVEEELLLALPLVAAHEVGKCSADVAETVPDAPVEEERPNPFAVLRGKGGSPDA